MRLICCRSARTAAVVVAVALAVPFAGVAPTVPVYARAAPDSFADLAAKLLPAVVNISSTQAAQARAGAPGGPGAGPEVPMFPPGSPFEQFFKDFLNRNRPGGPGEPAAA
jgi:serine protease Do